MLCLGIETSCDETGVALVNASGLVAERLASQADIHSLFGGVVPELACREHLRVLPVLFADLLERSGASARDIDVVAVARGPGLLGSLLVGISFAKGLCLATQARLVGVNHLWAHLLAPGLEEEIAFPSLGLLVSGGHTHLSLMRSAVDFELLGRTLDDAAGEAFDKAAKKMNFPYPGGRFLDELGREADPDPSMFPRAYVDNDNLDFSFSGLKTALAQHVDRQGGLVPSVMGQVASLAPERRAHLARVCASFALAVADTLLIKTDRALDRVGGVRSLVVAGGVAANSTVRQAMTGLARRRGLHLVLPRPELCTDNAAMVAHAGMLTAQQGLFHGLDLEAVPRGRIVPPDWKRAG